MLKEFEPVICTSETCSCPFCTIISYVNLGRSHENLGWKFFSVFKLFLWNLFCGKFKTRHLWIAIGKRFRDFIKKIPLVLFFDSWQKEKSKYIFVKSSQNNGRNYRTIGHEKVLRLLDIIELRIKHTGYLMAKWTK